MRLDRLHPFWLVSLLVVLGTGRSSAQSTTTYPAWWTNPALTTSGTAVVSGTADDYAAVNQGQVKNFAVAAVNELDTDLWQFGGAGTLLESLSGSLTTVTTQTDDYAAVNLGQLKAIAQPFYNQLLAVGYKLGPLATGTYPWINAANPPDDFAMANIGQVKYLFSFDVTFCSGTNGLPDWWVEKYYGTTNGQPPSIDPNAFAVWSGSQITILQSYQQALNPIDYYNGQTPALVYVSGNGQVGTSGSFVSLPLIVNVSDGYGTPLNGAPVTFTVTSGGGTVQASTAKPPANSVTVLADSGGQAEIFFKLPNIVNTTCSISASAGPPGNPATVAFAESSDGGNGGWYPSPFIPSNVTGVVNGDGSLTINWQNNDEQSPIYIYQLQTSGTWIVTGTLPAGTISYTASASVVAEGALEIGNNDTSGGSTGNTGNGAGNNPGIAPILANNPIPMAHFAAIAISGTVGANYGLCGAFLALDDSNNVSFVAEIPVYQTGTLVGYWADVYVWQNGALNQVQNFWLPNVEYSSWSQINFLDAHGDAYVQATGTCGELGGEYIPNSNANPNQAPGSYTVAENGVSSDGSNIFYSGSSIIFAIFPTVKASSTTTIVIDDFNITGINNSGQAIGVETPPGPPFWLSIDAFWDGNSFHQLPGRPYCLNDQGQVVGVDQNGDGYLWQNDNWVLLANLVPAYKSQLAGIQPLCISNVDSRNYNATHILLNAGGKNFNLTYYAPGNSGTAPANTIVQFDPSDTSSDINGMLDALLGDFDMNICDSTDVYASINASGLIATFDMNGNAVVLVPAAINAYRPQMVLNSVDLSSTNPAQMIIPQSEVSGSGVHIRVNGDNENANLVEVTFSCPALATMINFTAAIQVSSTNRLQVWTTNQKGSAILNANGQGNLTLDGSGNATIWVEALDQGANDLNFVLVSGATTTGTMGSLHFVNYDSFTEVFSGETFTGGTAGTAAAQAQGTFNVAQTLYLKGYNIAYYNVNTVSDSTGQPAYGELLNEIQNGFVMNVGVCGYSHGGGETYNICSMLSDAEGTFGFFNVTFAGYIDAIEHSGSIKNGALNFHAENLCPPGVGYMWNYYEWKDRLHGNPIPGGNPIPDGLNVNTKPWGNSLVHRGPNSIAGSPTVQVNLESAIEIYVPQY